MSRPHVTWKHSTRTEETHIDEEKATKWKERKRNNYYVTLCNLIHVWFRLVFSFEVTLWTIQHSFVCKIFCVCTNEWKYTVSNCCGNDEASSPAHGRATAIQTKGDNCTSEISLSKFQEIRFSAKLCLLSPFSLETNSWTCWCFCLKLRVTEWIQIIIRKANYLKAK